MRKGVTATSLGTTVNKYTVGDCVNEEYSINIGRVFHVRLILICLKKCQISADADVNDDIQYCESLVEWYMDEQG